MMSRVFPSLSSTFSACSCAVNIFRGSAASQYPNFTFVVDDIGARSVHDDGSDRHSRLRSPGKRTAVKSFPLHRQAVHGDNHIHEHAYRSIIPVQPGQMVVQDRPLTGPSGRPTCHGENTFVGMSNASSGLLETWSLVRLEYKTAAPHFLFVLGPPRMMACKCLSRWLTA
ncbi:hypothetical protein EDC04DRAFT_1275720 [Pisolithus marmoratus]|nr:hypothetical protein EDC04DRAFT_1275720 [Pisolithus marmoratus]